MRCAYCEYDLSGLTQLDRCPECGEIVDPAYLKNLMKHATLREELLLHRIAAVGWAMHEVLLGVLLTGGAPWFLIVPAMAVVVGLALLTMWRGRRARASWPRRFAARRSGREAAAPRGTLLAIVAWLVPSIVVCGLLSGA